MIVNDDIRWVSTENSWLKQCYLLKIADDHMRWLSTGDSWLKQCYQQKIADYICDDYLLK